MAGNDGRPAPEPGTGEPPASPWVLVDEDTVAQTAVLLERLVSWLGAGAPRHTASCANALSRGETDPDGVASWADCLAARLRRRAEGGELLARPPSTNARTAANDNRAGAAKTATPSPAGSDPADPAHIVTSNCSSANYSTHPNRHPRTQKT
jgi:hypothetical protein